MSVREVLGSYFAVRDARLGQMGDMLQVTGAIAGLEQDLCMESEFRTAIRRCLSCDRAEVCKTWLEKAEQNSAVPAFCPNATRFEGLILR